jgi:hypothetical protein
MTGGGLTKIYQTPNGKFISECDWSDDGSKNCKVMMLWVIIPKYMLLIQLEQS